MITRQIGRLTGRYQPRSRVMPAMSAITARIPDQVPVAAAAQASTAGVRKIQEPGPTGAPVTAPSTKNPPHSAAPNAGARRKRMTVVAAKAVKTTAPAE